ncbi:MAG: cell envelope integrity protein TolA [Proteobacteria bacterium]|jgi:colicin import membrane protein|nr:cell envelope integrity protein TolA [Pseudomonadota bacterium]
MTSHDRPARARRPRGRLIALILAIGVNLLFVGVLVFSVTWQNREPAAVTAELYAPPSADLTPLPAARLPEVAPPRPLPAPPQLPPVPAPAPKPPPAPPPVPSQADIELKAKQEAAKQQEAKREAEQKAKQEAKRQAEQQAKALASMQAQAQRELQTREDAERLRRQAEAEAQMRAQAEQEAQARAQQAAAATARSRAEADWIDRIRSKIRSNVNLPPEISGNPEAIFDVVQLPTGEVLTVRMKQSSGIPAYDDAVQRAIVKSSPLPPPPSPDLFQRELVLRFHPHEP